MAQDCDLTIDFREIQILTSTQITPNKTLQ